MQYNECIKCIEYFQTAEYKNEPILATSLISPANISADLASALGKPNRKDLYKRIWAELESQLKCYQDVSERHRILYNHVRNMLISSLRSESILKNRTGQNSQQITSIKIEDVNNQM